MNMKRNAGASKLTRNEMKQVFGGYNYLPGGGACPFFSIPCPGRTTPNGVACCKGVADCQAAATFCASI
jgi:hypothetical protein